MFADILMGFSCLKGRLYIELTMSSQADIVNRLIEYINTKEGVEWVTMEQICDNFKSQSSPPSGAMMPAKPGAVLDNPNLELEKKA